MVRKRAAFCPKVPYGDGRPPPVCSQRCVSSFNVKKTTQERTQLHIHEYEEWKDLLLPKPGLPVQLTFAQHTHTRQKKSSCRFPFFHDQTPTDSEVIRKNKRRLPASCVCIDYVRRFSKDWPSFCWLSVELYWPAVVATVALLKSQTVYVVPQKIRFFSSYLPNVHT